MRPSSQLRQGETKQHSPRLVGGGRRRPTKRPAVERNLARFRIRSKSLPRMIGSRSCRSSPCRTGIPPWRSSVSTANLSNSPPSCGIGLLQTVPILHGERRSAKSLPFVYTISPQVPEDGPESPGVSTWHCPRRGLRYKRCYRDDPSGGSRRVRRSGQEHSRSGLPCAE
jgi:hypothetical protein